MSMIIGIQPSGKATDFDSVISLVRIQVSQPIWRFSSVGRASALQAEGQRFEPVNLHHSIKHNKIFAGLAQLVEQLTCNQQVEGSSPLAGTSNGEVAKWLNAADCNSVPFGSVVRIRPSPPLQDPLAQSVEHLTFNQRVRRSSRLRVTILICGCSSMVELQPSKLTTWVRFPSPAPLICLNSSVGRAIGC